MLMSYAHKEHSPYIAIEAFILFVEKHARHVVNEQPEWTRWAKDASRRLWEELGPLMEDGRCALITEKTGARIFLRRFYVDLLEQAYTNPDGSAPMPFPSEGSFKLKIPAEHIRFLNVTTDLVVYLDNPQKEEMPLIALVFPSEIPDALALSTMIPRRILEIAMLKIRHFLWTDDNKDYLHNKLVPHYQNKRVQLRDMFNRILTRPMDCLKDLESGDDVLYMFWSAFCGLARVDIVKKQDLLNIDIAILQSLYILEIMNSYFRAQAFKRKERETAFKDLDLHFDRPPYAFSMDAILNFTNGKGVPLLGLYSREHLCHWLEEKTRAAASGGLPELFVIIGPGDAKRYIKKARYFAFSEKALNEARQLIRQAVKERWIGIIREYRREPAMEHDKDYERLLQSLAEETSPELTAILADKKLCLVCDEAERTRGAILENSRLFFHGGELLPLAAILLIKRREILAETRGLLPFWYSMPLFVALVTLFRKLKNLRSRKKRKPGKGVSDGRLGENQEREMAEAGRRLKSEMVPCEEGIDVHLERLENRWNTLLTGQAREDLSIDVKTLVRDRLRQTLRGQRHIMLTRDSLENLAARIADENSVLRALKNREDLRQFIVLYMVKLLLQEKS
jgi:hypothetical protein